MANANYIEKLAHMPNWPALMRKEVAAMYVGPVSPSEFDKLVKSGEMPEPKSQGSIQVWRKADIDRMHCMTDTKNAGIAAGDENDWMNQLDNAS